MPKNKKKSKSNKVIFAQIGKSVLEFDVFFLLILKLKLAVAALHHLI
jgi:hypothetical protein